MLNSIGSLLAEVAGADPISIQLGANRERDDLFEQWRRTPISGLQQGAVTVNERRQCAKVDNRPANIHGTNERMFPATRSWCCRADLAHVTFAP